MLTGEKTSSIRKIDLERLTVITSQPFEKVVAALESAVSHPEIPTLFRTVASAKTYSEAEELLQEAVGDYGLMEFARFDVGAILRKEQGPCARRILRMMVGNALILKKMAIHVHDAASYAPVTILIDERQDGVHMSYDRMASYLAPYGNSEALNVARELDSKIEALIQAAGLPDA